MRDDTDDFELFIDEVEVETLANGVLIGEVFAREIFVDDADAGRTSGVLRAEEASAEQRNFHYLQIIGPNDVPVSVGHAVFGGGLGSAVDPKRQVIFFGYGDRAAHQRNSLHTGDG